MIKKMILKFVVAFITVILLIGQLPAADFTFALTPEELRKSIDEKTSSLREINEKIEQTQKNINAVENRGKTLVKEIDRFNYQINQLGLGIKSSEIKIEKLGLELEDLEYGISEKEQAISLRKDAITSFLRKLQEKDNENTLVIFLKSQSLADSVFETHSISALNDKLAEEIKLLYEIKEDLKLDLVDVPLKRNEIENVIDKSLRESK